MREVALVLGVGRVGLPVALIGERVQDAAMQMPQVELVLDEVARQLVQHLRMRRRIGGRLRVGRLDEAAAQVKRPHAIDDRPREVRIVLRRHPLPHFLARIDAPLDVDIGAAEDAGGQRLLRLRIDERLDRLFLHVHAGEVDLLPLQLRIDAAM